MISLRNPFAQPLHLLGLELLVIGGAALLFSHAWGRFRRGDRRPLFQWLVVFFYGLEMELIAFHFIQNYTHAQFTVQLYGGKLPLYVAAVYVVFLYSALELVRRLHRGPLTTAVLVGLCACLIDMPFDIAGVPAAWWVWHDGSGWAEQVIAYRWLGVPVTSYLWYLIFGAVLSLVLHWTAPKVTARGTWTLIGAAPIAGAMVILGGVVAFMPFHLWKAVGLSDGGFVAAYLGAAAFVAIYPPAPAAAALDRRILAVAILVPIYHVGLLAWMAAAGSLPGPAWRIGAACAALAGLGALTWLLPALGARRPTVEVAT